MWMVLALQGALYSHRAAQRTLSRRPRPPSLAAKVREPAKRPDLDKLVRAVKDALTKVLWHDDGQVVEILARKFYAQPGAPVGVSVLVGVR